MPSDAAMSTGRRALTRSAVEGRLCLHVCAALLLEDEGTRLVELKRLFLEGGDDVAAAEADAAWAEGCRTSLVLKTLQAAYSRREAAERSAAQARAETEALRGATSEAARQVQLLFDASFPPETSDARLS